MKYIYVSILFAALAYSSESFSFDSATFPESIGSDPALMRTLEIQEWGPENMYEQVNGEAELLIRYGSVKLTFVSYEHESGDYVSVELLDMSEPINAYALYRLYAGCDSKELNIHNAMVKEDEFTPYAFYGKYFLRINLDIDDDAHDGIGVVTGFLQHLTEHLPEPSSLPALLEYLKLNARTPCEVDYHPEHIDYDLETGPGYSWVGPGGSSYFLTVADSKKHAEEQAKELKDKGIVNASSQENAVIWGKGGEPAHGDYMKQILRNIGEK